MKKFFILSAVMMLGIMLSAQTQQGYVKTKGRLATDGSVIAGSRIPNATITVKGRTPVISQANGTFSFPIPANKFYLQNVKKQGYTLTDPEVLSKQYSYSANDLIIVMEDIAQLEADKRAIERKISGKLYAQLVQRGEELDALKEQNKITEEKYRELLQQLNKYQDDNEKIIKEMAERYTKMDFDQIDEFNRKVSEYILNGELTKADSMLNTKGNFSERAEQLKRMQAANTKEREELFERQTNLQESEAFTQTKLEDLANDCFRKFEIFKMQHMNDSAAYYLELRSSLNPLNTNWQMETSSFLAEYLGLFQQAKRIDSILINNTNHEIGKKQIAELYNHIGLLHTELSEYNEAILCLSKALEYYQGEGINEKKGLSDVYNNFGVTYDNLREFDQALYYYQKAIQIRKDVFGENSESVATIYNNIGYVFAEQRQYDVALEYYNKALSILRSLFGNNHQDVGMSLMNIGGVYFQQQNYDTAFNYMIQAQEILENILGEYHPKVGLSYNNIGSIYQDTGDYDKAVEYSQKAIKIIKNVLGENSMIMATMYSNLASIYKDKKDYQAAIEYNEKSLLINEAIYGENSQGSLYVAVQYKALGRIYQTIGDFSSAESSFKKALEIEKRIFETPNIYLYYAYLDLADLYFNNGLYEQSYELYNEMQIVTETLYGIESVKAMENMGGIYFSLIAEYNQTQSERVLQKYNEFMSTHIITATAIDGSVSTQVGLSGLYYILSIEDWEFTQPQSITEKIISLQGKPKTIVIMKDGIISEHHFENSLGMRTGFSVISKEEKQSIVDAFNLWKQQKK